MQNLKSVIHAYSFDTTKAGDRAAYDELCAKLKGLGLDCFETHGGASHYMPKLDGVTVELETTHLFSNQWNTAPIEGVSDKGLRVFDWAQDYRPNGCSTRKRGHWIEQTAEMKAARENTVCCGYCGKQEPSAKGLVFCPHCLDSEYLTLDTLHLLRMLPTSLHNPNRGKLTAAEHEWLYPQFKSAQLHGTTERGKARIAKARKDLVIERDKAIYQATTKHDGMIWLLDKGLKIDNVIYYTHTDRFSFGWRQAVDDGVVSEILEIISEFPFNYEIKCADGRMLSN